MVRGFFCKLFLINQRDYNIIYFNTNIHTHVPIYYLAAARRRLRSVESKSIPSTAVIYTSSPTIFFPLFYYFSYLYVYILSSFYTSRPLRLYRPHCIVADRPPVAVNQPHKIVSYSPTPPTPVVGPLNMQCYAKSR